METLSTAWEVSHQDRSQEFVTLDWTKGDFQITA